MEGYRLLGTGQVGRDGGYTMYIPLSIREELQYKERICCVRTTDKLQISVIHTLSKMAVKELEAIKL
jgi:hypothetical protein